MKNAKMNPYALPFFRRSSLDWYFRGICIFIIVPLSILASLSVYLLIKYETDIEFIIVTYFFVLIDFFTLYLLYFYDIARKAYIEITEEYIKFRGMYKSQKFIWSEIDSSYLNSYTRKSITYNYIGIVLKEHPYFHRKRQIKTGISLIWYPDVNADKLL